MIRVGTFNLNNLFDRFNFHAALPQHSTARATYRWRLAANRDVLPPIDDGPLMDPEGAELIEGTGPVRIELSPMGQLVKPKPPAHLEALLHRTDRLNADVLAVQEVENLRALREFNAILDAPYPFVALIEGNDPRFIDVGLLSRLPIGSVTSNRWEPDPADPSRFLFARDLMSVDILDHARANILFTVWVAHLKSKFVEPGISDPARIAAAQQANDDRRRRQATAAHDIIAARHDVANDRFIVCGDFNDHPGNAPLDPLLNGALALQDVFVNGVNVVFERPENEGPRVGNPEDQAANENWTHRFSVSHAADVYERLDHFLVSAALQGLVANAYIQRRTHWGKQHAGSDHDPIVVELNLNS